MNTRDINNYFGDMDLYLIDAILKGRIPDSGSVLDVGCGEGRNGIFFIRGGYNYVGLDRDISQIRLIEYLSKTITKAKARFLVDEIRTFESDEKFDLIICSRMLHFATDKSDFSKMWAAIEGCLAEAGVLYVSMDSAVENLLAKAMGDGQYKFPDGKIRYAMTEALYHHMKKGFEEIEPLRTVVHHKKRAQSFMLLKKN